MSEPSVHGIVKSDFQSWRHHPVSKVVLLYMRDFRAALHHDMLAAFEAGTLDLAVEHEARGRCKTLAELADLPFEAILSFYQEETEDEAEANQSV